MELSGELPGRPAADPGAPADAPPPGPPFPEPEIDRAVYDFAGVFEPETIAAVEETIDRIEERTKAEVVVYTQVVDSPTTEETERHALALINQWGVGRKGFDDGLAIFFDFEPGRSSGQVQLYAAPGFAATFLTNSERQADLRERHAPAPPRGRLGRGDPRRDGSHRRGGHARERGAARAGPAAQCRRSAWSERR